MTRGQRLRTFALVLAAAMALTALVNCGGRIEATSSLPDAGGGPVSSDASANENTAPAPDIGSGCPAPSLVNSGFACSVPGQTCRSNYLDHDCQGQPAIPVHCTCGQGSWSCTHASPMCSATSPCPDPAMIQQGGLCTFYILNAPSCPSATPVYDCSGSVVGHLLCQCVPSGWQCEKPTPLSCVDASMPPATCPDPSSLVEGTGCVSSGLTCKGNPTQCGGATFYDALQCDGTKFVTVAMTECGIDASAGAD